MVLRLFSHPLSQPCRAVMIYCKMNSIPIQETLVDLGKGEQKGSEFTQKIGPLQRVPVLEHDGFFLPESVAILRYLNRTYEAAPNWYPKDSKLQAKVDSYMAWQHLNTRHFGVMYFQTLSLIPKTTKQPVDEKQAKIAKEGLEKVLDQFTNYWLKDTRYVAGNDITLADLLAVTELEQPGMAGFDVKAYNKRIEEYMENVSSKLQPHYDEIHSMCHKIQKKAMNKG